MESAYNVAGIDVHKRMLAVVFVAAGKGATLAGRMEPGRQVPVAASGTLGFGRASISTAHRIN